MPALRRSWDPKKANDGTVRACRDDPGPSFSPANSAARDYWSSPFPKKRGNDMPNQLRLAGGFGLVAAVLITASFFTQEAANDASVGRRKALCTVKGCKNGYAHKVMFQLALTWIGDGRDLQLIVGACVGTMQYGDVSKTRSVPSSS
ncbi:hypothetical protein CCHR01_09087 [Colletotrichum chrysophilum]|uniref:Uncharacterized protein n=1 Tax=Colletotrichum chrysophilum TaxID=1836956 RepID=A0AAD9EEF9_9PEZI|nr:hypothetical protein CCHR01_09087 [Colletotrichum chrysophilum]